MNNDNHNKRMKLLEVYFNNMTDEQVTEFNNLSKSNIPKGWIAIEDHLPTFNICDFTKGYSEYIVKYEDGTEDTTKVTDHNVWKYYAKEENITHWLNE